MRLDWVALALALRDFLAGLGIKVAFPGVQVTATKDLGSFHHEPTPPWAMDETRDMAHAHPELRRRYEQGVKPEFIALSGKHLFETSVWRSARKQNQYFLEKKTKIDGIGIRSRHNVYPAQAVDVAVDLDPGSGKHVSWNPRHFDLLGPLAAKHGLIWGGEWKGKFYGPDGDYPHLELPPGFDS